MFISAIKLPESPKPRETSTFSNRELVVGALPALPNKDIPSGAVMKLMIDGKKYRCCGDKWMPLEEVTPDKESKEDDNGDK